MGNVWQMLVNGVATILKYLYEFTVTIGLPSYGLAIILLTLLIKAVLHPLMHKQMVSMKKMQELQPKITELQAKYKKTPEKAQKAVMDLYKEHNANPMAGCLPMLVQMPILIALFTALRNFQYQDLGSSFFWVPHLKDPDPIYIIPVLVGLATYFQTKLSTPTTATTKSSAASMQKTMLYVMPLFIGYISIKFPAGLGLYWIFFSVFGTLQQLYINRKPTLEKGGMGSK